MASVKIEDELTKKIEQPDEIVKQVKLQHTGRQYILQIPADVVNALDLEKGDIFIIKVPLENKNEHLIKLKRKVK